MIKDFDAKLFLISKAPEFFGDTEILNKILKENLGEISQRNPKDPEPIYNLLVDNAVSALELIKDHLRDGMRILEIGGGSGLLHICLKHLGYSVISIEPALAGHSDSYDLGKLLIKKCGYSTNDWLPLAAHEIEGLGEFDLIFSQNVLEHVSLLDQSIQAMAHCLKPNGVMIHNCPNYIVPYEPHFGLPLIPFFPRYTSLFLRWLKSSSLWLGLNFITSYNLKKIALKNGLEIYFDSDHFYNTWLRLEKEPLFKTKHPGLFKIFLMIKFFGLLRMLKAFPAMLVTPMNVQMSKRQA